MILIAHRGLVSGPNPELENTESAISFCLENGYHTEIDLWLIQNEWYLGHDSATYKTSYEFISQPNIWIHAKNFDAASKLSETDLTYFWHENDERVLTSNGFWWTYPNKELSSRSIALMPEWHLPIESLSDCLTWKCAGICSDYVIRLNQNLQ